MVLTKIMLKDPRYQNIFTKVWQLSCKFYCLGEVGLIKEDLFLCFILVFTLLLIYRYFSILIFIPYLKEIQYHEVPFQL